MVVEEEVETSLAVPVDASEVPLVLEEVVDPNCGSDASGDKDKFHPTRLHLLLVLVLLAESELQ